MNAVRGGLTIAGSDSGGGAGIQADLRTFAAFGLHGTCAVTAITAQNTLGVLEMDPVPADLVRAQIRAVASDIRIDATKIGMLATGSTVDAVARAIDEFRLPNVVLDPVLASSNGERLLDAGGVRALLDTLLPRARVVTPNIPEAEALSGLRIASPDDRRRAAEQLHEMGAGAVIVTGGHAPASIGDGNDVVDLLWDGTTFVELRTPRAGAHRIHGTGCTFASAVAAGLALGLDVAEAAARAQQYVAGAIAHGTPVGAGAWTLDHFWNWSSG